MTQYPNGDIRIKSRTLRWALSLTVVVVGTILSATVTGTALLMSIDQRIANIEENPYRWQRHQMQQWSQDAERQNEGWRSPPVWSEQYNGAPGDGR